MVVIFTAANVAEKQYKKDPNSQPEKNVPGAILYILCFYYFRPDILHKKIPAIG